MAALFTGRVPSIESKSPETPLNWNGRTWCGLVRLQRNENDGLCVPLGVPTLAEAMRAAGYTTVGVVSNELLFKPAGYDRGFDEWVEVGWRPPKGAARLGPLMVRSRSARAVNDVLLRAVRDRSQARLFLYVHYMDVHDWYIPGDPTRPYERFSNYGKAVGALDAAIGALLDALDELDLLAGPTVVLTADHGEALGEEHLLPGMTAHFGNPSHEAVLRVPLIVAPPIHEDTKRLVRSQDVFGLVHRLIAPERHHSGRDAEVGRDELFVGERLYQTYRRGTWKSVRRRTDGAHFLFDLVNDPNERCDVAAERPDLVTAHEQRLDEITSHLATTGDSGGALTPLDRARLRALGYLE